MSDTFNIYCDESCHLEHDGQPFMVMGAVWCRRDKVREISMRLRDFRKRYGLKPDFEIKWTKVSPALERFYLDLLDYFYDDDDLYFRTLIADKRRLTSSAIHDDWYYEMYFKMLEVLLDPQSIYHIYLDIKDSRSVKKVRRLRKHLCQSVEDYDQKVVANLQSIRSHESSIMQLTDLLIGAIAYANRGEYKSSAKTHFVERLKERAQCNLVHSTWPRVSKTNIFVWPGLEDE